MADTTNIEWADSTFNPWIGCTKVSPACEHCYAENLMDTRMHKVQWGAGQTRQRTSVQNWNLPLRWEREHAQFYAEHGRRRRVFCASLADVFDKEVPEQWRYDLWQLIHQTPNLDWLLLTKRIGNAKQPEVYRTLSWPHNVWLGATICNQAEADRDIPKLLEVPAKVRFLSIEPLLGAIKLPRVDFHCDLCGGTGILGRWPKGKCHHCNGVGNLPAISTDPKFGVGSTPMRFIHWVIVGGESGANARPMHPDWVRSLRDQCKAAGVPFLFKQWGEWLPISEINDGTDYLYQSNKKAKAHESQAAIDDIYGRSCIFETGMIQIDGQLLSIQQMDSFKHGAMQGFKVGKKAAGRLLDGVTHTEFPKVRNA